MITDDRKDNKARVVHSPKNITKETLKRNTNSVKEQYMKTGIEGVFINIAVIIQQSMLIMNVTIENIECFDNSVTFLLN